MTVVVIAPPEPLVSLDLTKKHLRVDASNTDDDDLITAYIAAASANIDGPGGWLGRAIGPQTLELELDGFYAPDWRVGPGYAWTGCWTGDAWGEWPFRRIKLPYPPFVSVVSITYEDGSGVDQVLTSAGWTATDQGVEPSFGADWPSGRVAADAVRIQYQAGYEVTPAPIVAAVLMMVADLYANREAQQIDQSRGVAVDNPTVDALLGPFKVWQA